MRRTCRLARGAGVARVVTERPTLRLFETTQMARCYRASRVWRPAPLAAPTPAVSRDGSGACCGWRGYEELPAGTPSSPPPRSPTAPSCHPVDYGSTEAKRSLCRPAPQASAGRRAGWATGRRRRLGRRGVGVRCTVPISKGQIVCEIVGEYHYGEAARESPRRAEVCRRRTIERRRRAPWPRPRSLI